MLLSRLRLRLTLHCTGQLPFCICAVGGPLPLSEVFIMILLSNLFINHLLPQVIFCIWAHNFWWKWLEVHVNWVFERHSLEFNSSELLYLTAFQNFFSFNELYLWCIHLLPNSPLNSFDVCLDKEIQIQNFQCDDNKHHLSIKWIRPFHTDLYVRISHSASSFVVRKML